MSLQSANHQKHNFSDRQKLSLKNMKNQKKPKLMWNLLWNCKIFKMKRNNISYRYHAQ